MKNQIIADIRLALHDSADEKTKLSFERFFKEEIKVYGVKTAEVAKIGKYAFQQIKHLPKNEIFALCEELWKSGYSEEAYIACNWAYSIHKQFSPDDFKVFEHWVNNYVSNWAACDTLCNHTIGTFVTMYPEYINELKRWAKSDNRWTKRAAAVTLIIPARNALFLDDIMEIAEILLLDNDDMVQKGYGWMLKAASLTESPFAAVKKTSIETQNKHQEAIFNFVMKHKAVMPRTSLRYAIEKMPQALRVEAMKK